MESSRRSVLRSLPSLWLIGVCLFLPMVRACEKMESPASLVAHAPVFWGALLSPLLVAELIVVVAVVALARGRLSRAASRATLALVAASSSSSLVLGIGAGLRGGEHLWAAGALACFAAATMIVWRARRRDPWTRHARMLAAYTVLTLPVTALLVVTIVGAEPGRIGVGAWLYLVAVAALAAVQPAALWRGRDPVASSPG